MSRNGASARSPASEIETSAPASWGRAMLIGGAALTGLRLLWLAAQPADLYPDEAQYWFWAQFPAFGYYSKPPLVAWIIALTTTLAGDGEFAVRLAAPLLHAVAAAFVYGIGARLYDPRTGFWAGIAYLTLPGISVSAFVISTDAALLPCWAAALWAFVRAGENGGWRWWIAVGLASGLGLLAKYAMAYWLLSAFGLVLLSRSERRHLRGLCGAAILALLIYLPNLWWNWQHGFASYLHLRDNADLAGASIHPSAFLEFFGAQFGVFGPLFFAGLIGVCAAWGRLCEPRARLLAAFSLPPLGMMLLVSLFSRAHANWAAPAYVSATVLVVAWALARGWRRLVATSVALNLLAAAALFGGHPALAALGIELPAKYDPLHRLRGWRALGHSVAGALAAHPGFGLLADDRETLAALIYYVRPHPLDAAKWRFTRHIKDHWDLTNDLSKHLGESFLLVSAHHLVDEMRPSFAAIEPLGRIVIPIGSDAARTYGLYLARDFKGYRPSS